jgi:hypothetical protein
VDAQVVPLSIIRFNFKYRAAALRDGCDSVRANIVLHECLLRDERKIHGASLTKVGKLFNAVGKYTGRERN